MAKIDDNEHQRPAPHNKPSQQHGATQRNEPQRTSESRNDRESQVGGSNQSQARRGGGQGGKTGH